MNKYQGLDFDGVDKTSFYEYLLNMLKMLQQKELESFFLDKDEYKEGVETLKQFDILISPEYYCESFFLIPVKIGCRVYLNNERNQKRVEKHLKKNKKSLLIGLINLGSFILCWSFIIYIWLCTFNDTFIRLLNDYH